MKKDKKPIEIDHADRGHAEFSPSGIKPISVCSGYHGKDGNSKPATLGTFVHEDLETLDPSRKDKPTKVITQESVDAKLAKLKTKHDDIDFDFELSDIEDMNFLFNKIKKMEKANLKEMFGEKVGKKWQGVNVFEVILDMDLGDYKTFGTCDRLTISKNGRIGLLADYKTGVSVIEFPRDNHQAITYMIGVFQAYPRLERLYFSFYVPQNGNKPQTGFFLRAELDEFVTLIRDIIHEATITRPMWGDKKHPPLDRLTTGDQCRFCRHIGRCEKAALEAVDAFDLLDVVESSPDPKTVGFALDGLDPLAMLDPESYPEDVEKLWRISKRMEAWGEEFRAKVTALGKAGLEYDTLKLRQRKGRTSITDSDEIKRLAIETFEVGEDEINSASTITLNKLADLTDDPTRFKSTAEKKKLTKVGETSYYMQAPRVPKKKNPEPTE